jgi:peroxiredoxin
MPTLSLSPKGAAKRNAVARANRRVRTARNGTTALGALALVLFSEALGCSQGPRFEHGPQPKPAPDFELTALDGQQVKLSDFRGRPVVLAFFAVACGPCRAEAPHLSELAERYAGEGLVVLAVNAWDEDEPAVRRFANDHGLKQRILLYGQEVGELYGLNGSVPAVTWIDRHGRIVDFEGGFSGKRSLVRRTNALLKAS